ncbi:MAG: type II secretion system protein GspN [Deltaproteobacteria bacterium]|nr:type II secretion system protein GspN [Deltaproteobacteria bacterium]
MGGDARKRLLKIIGYPVFFLVLFAAFLVVTFPLDRFAPLIRSKLSSFLERDVTIGDVSLSLLGDIVLKGVEIEVPSDGAEPEPEPVTDGAGKDGKKPAKAPRLTYFVDEMSIDVGLFAFLVGSLHLDIEAEAMGGTIDVSYEGPMPGEQAQPAPAPLRRRGAAKGEEAQAEATADEEPVSLRVEVADVDLSKAYDLRRKLPVPVSGTIGFTFEIESPTGRFDAANGSLALNAAGVAVGDDKAKVMGMTVDRLLLGDFGGEMEIKDGAGKVKKIEIRSKDFEASVQGEISFETPLSRSRLDLYMMFKFLEAYKNKSERTRLLVPSLDTFSKDLKRAHRTDGFYGFRYRGAFGIARFIPSKDYAPEPKAKRTREPKRSRRTPGSGRRPAADSPLGPAAPPLGEGPAIREPAGDTPGGFGREPVDLPRPTMEERPPLGVVGNKPGTAPEIAPPEETPTEQAPPEQAPPEEVAPPEEIPPEQAPPEQGSGEAPPEQGSENQGADTGA